MDSDVVRRLADIARRAPSADNTQPWRMEWDGEHLAIYYDTARVAGKTFPADSPGTLLSMGALIESLLAVADSWALRPELELAQRPGAAAAAPFARIAFTAPADPEAITDTHPVTLRHTNRGGYTRQLLPQALVAELTGSRQGAARSWFSQEPAARARAADLVKSASRIRFRTREIHQWLSASLRFTPAAVAAGDGLDVDTLALPPGGRAMLHLISDWRRLRYLNQLGMHHLLAAIDSAPVRAGPGLLAVIAPAEPQHSIDAGRLLARQWHALNQHGLAVHPYYVVADQLARLRSGSIPPGLEPTARDVAAASKDVFGLAGAETLHMLLRVGYSRKPAKSALRLPLERVYRDTTRS